jgi:hypothetical protein
LVECPCNATQLEAYLLEASPVTRFQLPSSLVMLNTWGSAPPVPPALHDKSVVHSPIIARQIKHIIDSTPHSALRGTQRSAKTVATLTGMSATPRGTCWPETRLAMTQPRPQQSLSGPTEDFLEWLRKNQSYAKTDPEIEERLAFFPISEVKKALGADNREWLDDILDELFQPDDPPDSVTLLNKYAAVFCILLEIGKGRAIADFIRKELHDQRLPHPNSEPPGFPQYGGDGTFYKRFYAKQWRFCAPEFEKNMDTHFEADRILPIVRKERLGGGGSATLYEIKLHSSYNLLLPQPHSIAVRHLRIFNEMIIMLIESRSVIIQFEIPSPSRRT